MRHDNDVTKTRTIVSEVRRDLANTYNVVSDIHRNMLKNQEATNSQRRSVSDHHALSIAE